MTIHWTPPDSDGGSQITEYVIYYGDDAMGLDSFLKPELAGHSTNCTFSKQMKYNKMYKFAVAAENESGLGPLSEFSECVKTPTISVVRMSPFTLFTMFRYRRHLGLVFSWQCQKKKFV